MFPPKTSDRTVVLSRNAHDSVESWITQIKRVGFYVNPSFTPEQFPAIKEHTWQSTTLRFFPFNPKKGSPLFQLKRRRLGRPTYEHGLCFAALYPSYPENVLFFHEPVYLPHVLHWGGLVTTIIRNNGCRYFCLSPADFEWGRNLYLAGVE